MAPRAWVPLLALSLFLAGCTTPPSAPGDASGAQTGNGGDQVLTPQWSVGDHWDYDAPPGSFSLVVAGEQGGDWIMETTDPGLAWFHAMNDLSFLGSIRKSDLAGSQGSQRVNFFDFPLEDGKQWTTNWDGETVGVKAHEESEGVFRIEVDAGGAPYAEYVYDADVGFFQEVTWFGIDDGEDMWIRLSGHGSSFSGTLHRYEIGQTHAYVHELTDTGLYELDVGADWNELAFTAVLLCDEDPVGQVAVGVNPPGLEEDPLPMFPMLNEPEYGAMVDCMEEDFWHDSWLAPNPGGTWQIGFIVGAPNGVAHLYVTEQAHLEISFP